MDATPLPFIAYELVEAMPSALERASGRRRWMDETDSQFAYRCLPLVIANQSGWVVSNAVGVTAVWLGGRGSGDIRIAYDPGKLGFGGWTPPQCVRSHFGEGVLTFVMPYLFRTPPGYNLWVKGPANLFKDGIQALEGVVETDWAHATFTMNWKFTRANHPVRFNPGEPICQLVPYPRGLLERIEPQIRSLHENADVEAAFLRWRESRQVFGEQLKIPGSDAQRRGWEKGYMKGEVSAGDQFAGHQTSLKLRDFERMD